VFVILGWKKLAKDKHSGLLRKLVKYGQKKFYNIGPRSMRVVASLAITTIRYTSKRLLKYHNSSKSIKITVLKFTRQGWEGLIGINKTLAYSQIMKTIF